MLTVRSGGRLDDVAELLPRYLGSLRGPQEAWLQEQLFVRDVEVALVRDSQETVGYACADREHELLLQFYLQDSALSSAEPAFRTVLEELGLKKAYVTTRDPLALSLVLEVRPRIELESYLFEYAGEPWEPGRRNRMSLRLARAEDLPRIAAASGEFFPNRKREIEEGELHVLTEGDALRGIGYLSTRHCSPGTGNLGVYIPADLRGMGLGSTVLQELKRCCDARGLAPIAACYHENVASRRTLEAAGFVSRDRTFLASF
jgi:L-amino acid N-acyltransferase YncA